MKVVEVALMMVVVAVGARLGRGDTRDSGEHGFSSFRPSIRVSSNPHVFRPMGRDGRSFSPPTSSYSSIASSASTFSSPTVVRANMVNKFSLPSNFGTGTSRSTTGTLNFGDDSSEFFLTGRGRPTLQSFGSTSLPFRAAPSQSYGPPAAPSKSYGPPSVGLRTDSLEHSNERFPSNFPPRPSVGPSRPISINFDDSFERHTPSTGFSSSFDGLKTHTSNSFDHNNPTRDFPSQRIRPTPHSFQSGSSFQPGSSFGSSTSHSGSFERLRPQSISFDNSFERLSPSSFQHDDSIEHFPTLRHDDSSKHFPVSSTRFVTPTISPTSYITPTSSGFHLSRNSHEDLSSGVLRNFGSNFGSRGSRKSVATSIGGKSSEEFAVSSIGAHPNYQFEYKVNQPQTSSYSSHSTASHGHREQRKGKRTEGSYFVDLPDGRRQIVDYYADHTGYHPTITYV